ncbi:hypothetical protein AB0F16_40750, partial [Streptomyces tanashiensis]
EAAVAAGPAASSVSRSCLPSSSGSGSSIGYSTPETRAAYGPAGRAAVEGRTWEALGDELIGQYLEVLRERTAVAA